MYLPVEGGHFAELHLHLTDVDQELVDSIDVRDQDDLAFRTFGLYDDNMEVMGCAVMAIPIIMEVVNVKLVPAPQSEREEEVRSCTCCQRPERGRVIRSSFFILLIRSTRNFLSALLRIIHLYTMSTVLPK